MCMAKPTKRGKLRKAGGRGHRPGPEIPPHLLPALLQQGARAGRRGRPPGSRESGGFLRRQRGHFPRRDLPGRDPCRGLPRCAPSEQRAWTTTVWTGSRGAGGEKKELKMGARAPKGSGGSQRHDGAAAQAVRASGRASGVPGAGPGSSGGHRAAPATQATLAGPVPEATSRSAPSADAGRSNYWTSSYVRNLVRYGMLRNAGRPRSIQTA